MSSLKIKVPKNLSDENASIVNDLLREIFCQWEASYYVQIRRFENARLAARRDPDRPWEPVRTKSNDGTADFDDELPF